MKYIREKDGKYQCRIYNVELKFSFTDADLDSVVQMRNQMLGYDPDNVSSTASYTPSPYVTWTYSTVVQPPKKKVSFGALGDTHIGSKWFREDILNAIYDRFVEEGISVVFHTGNYIEGEANFNSEDIHVRGMDNQIKEFVLSYPQRQGITTYFISGDDHEGWYKKSFGVDIGLRTQQTAESINRHDLRYMGHVEVDVDYGGKKIRVMHPGGGSAQSISLAGQRIVDTYVDADKPDILLVGHYHKAHFLPSYKGVDILQTGSCVEQSPWARKLNIQYVLGAWVVDMHKWGSSATYIPFEPTMWRNKSVFAVS